MKHSIKAIAVVALVAGAGTAYAGDGINSMSGDLQLIAPPGSVRPGVLESNDHAFVFVEAQNFTLGVEYFGGGGGLGVDIITPGNYDSLSALSPGFIDAKTTVNSYFFHQDPLGSRNPDGLFADFEISFENEILGIIVLGDRTNGVSGSTLDDSDFIGELNTGTVYPKNSDGMFRGTFDSTSRLDQIQFSADRHTMTVGMLANSFGIDQIRVITAVPGPSVLAMLGLVVGMRGRRRRGA